ncbi:DUF7686 domain-containing protein [Burkholderia dolosa]|uniref:DUF7686 domain-containing protein n=1 Tax=Burkholderia dolosa TaxID=152500 RepID=UPI003D15FA82
MRDGKGNTRQFVIRAERLPDRIALTAMERRRALSEGCLTVRAESRAATFEGLLTRLLRKIRRRLLIAAWALTLAVGDEVTDGVSGRAAITGYQAIPERKVRQSTSKNARNLCRNARFATNRLGAGNRLESRARYGFADCA